MTLAESPGSLLGQAGVNPQARPVSVMPHVASLALFLIARQDVLEERPVERPH